MLASACGCRGPRVQVRPVLTSETAATTVPLREETYEAAAVPSGSCAREEDGDGEAGCIVPAAIGPPPGVRTAGSRSVAEGPAAAGPVREELCGAGASHPWTAASSTPAAAPPAPSMRRVFTRRAAVAFTCLPPVADLRARAMSPSRLLAARTRTLLGASRRVRQITPAGSASFWT